MKAVIIIFLSIPHNASTSTELYARRLHYLDPTGDRSRKLNLDHVVDSYNHRVQLAGHAKASHDMYESILFTILCGISSNSISYSRENRCRAIEGNLRHRARRALSDLFGLQRALDQTQISQKAVGSLGQPKRKKVILLGNPRQRREWIEGMQRSNGFVLKSPEPVKFDEIALAWEKLLSTNGESFSVNNKVVVHGLSILNGTGIAALIPDDSDQRSKIIEYFCIIFRAFYKLEKERHYVSECSLTNPPSDSDYFSAIKNLKEEMEKINLGMRTKS